MKTILIVIALISLFQQGMGQDNIFNHDNETHVEGNAQNTTGDNHTEPVHNESNNANETADLSNATLEVGHCHTDVQNCVECEAENAHHCIDCVNGYFPFVLNHSNCTLCTTLPNTATCNSKTGAPINCKGGYKAYAKDANGSCTIEDTQTSDITKWPVLNNAVTFYILAVILLVMILYKAGHDAKHALGIEHGHGGGYTHDHDHSDGQGGHGHGHGDDSGPKKAKVEFIKQENGLNKEEV